MPARTAASSNNKVEVELYDPDHKKGVVRFDARDTDQRALLRTVYIGNAALNKLGSPSAVKITIEALEE